ncbi:peptidoglycan-binding domain-containing protein [Micromonospora endolithica]|uniref:Peptidoglycan-binding protein n=1 Tax=Micromonospora endolithica TaxID=230091 RepID=A0A3A9YUQ2_9ACTN|nr:peptidoglycan-binding domain-containing protein [Micromonospora endolithica]RKN39670.1 peptidoglycan-binding protein [Micromonospora endolithica]TWJ22183.1 putative peptidoglycan binding protein [Micromonospora endolithica]
MINLNGGLGRWAIGAVTLVASTAVAVGVSAAPAQAAAPRCNAVAFIPYIHGGGGQLEVPVYRTSGSNSLLCVMSYGDRGDDVSQLQWTLNYCYGEGLSLDGDFGSRTKSALIRAQKREGIGADGIYGPQTAQALRFPWIPYGGCRET